MICTTDILTNAELEFINELDNHFPESQGRDCRFYMFDNKGIKIYRSQRMARFTFLLQSFFSKRDLAPKCWGYFEVRLDKKIYYGYFTQVAFPLTKHTEYFSRKQLADKFKDVFEAIVAEKKRKRTAWTMGLLADDLHSGNCALLNDKMVIIDFSYYNG